MPRSLVLLIYNIILPVFFVIAFPAWLLKMWRRGGYGTGLRERFAIFDRSRASEPKGVYYVHAVSVGEVLIALKLIQAMLEIDASMRIVLAATTSTGHAVAREKASGSVRVIYSPVDFNFIVKAVFARFVPRQVILIEAEAWPNLLRIAQKKDIPVTIVNARLSARSETRFKKFKCLVAPIFEMVTRIGVQDSGDQERFQSLGIAAEKIRLTGSIKFDSSGGQLPCKRDEFQQLLDDFGNAGGGGRQVLLVASSHAGEEKLIAQAIKNSGADVILAIVPRHAERRAEITADLSEAGYQTILKSKYHAPESVDNTCLVIDTTGELCDWTAHANWVVIGKSWLSDGGQTPAEAIAAGIPVICGPHMENFQPFVSQLCEHNAIIALENIDQFTEMLPSMIGGEIEVSEMTSRAQDLLSGHNEAIVRTLELLEVNASVGNGKSVEN